MRVRFIGVRFLLPSFFGVAPRVRGVRFFEFLSYRPMFIFFFSPENALVSLIYLQNRGAAGRVYSHYYGCVVYDVTFSFFVPFFSVFSYSVRFHQIR